MTVNIIPRVSFSIWEYCFSDGSRDLDAWATAFRESSGSLRRMQAPMPYELVITCDYDVDGGGVMGEGEIRNKISIVLSNNSWHSGVFLIFSNDSWHSGGPITMVFPFLRVR